MNYIRIGSMDFPEQSICKIYQLKNPKSGKEDLYLQDFNGHSYCIATGISCDIYTYRDALYGLLGWTNKSVPEMPEIIYEHKTIKDTEEFSVALSDSVGYESPIYESTNNFVAIVEEDGNVIGTGYGFCDIKVYFTKPIKALARVVHLTVLPEQPKIIKSEKQMVVGTSEIIPVREIDGFSNTQWASSKVEIATVNNAGRCTAKSEGTTLLSVYYSSPYKAKIEEITLTVVPPSPSVKTEDHVVKQGLSLQGFMPINNKFSGAEWSVKSGGENVSVNQNGVIEGKKVGKGVVVGKYTKPYKTEAIIYNITVDPTPEEADIQNIIVNPEQVKINTDAVVAVEFSKAPLGTPTLECNEFATVQDALEVEGMAGHANITGVKAGAAILTVKLGAKVLTKQIQVVE